MIFLFIFIHYPIYCNCYPKPFNTSPTNLPDMCDTNDSLYTGFTPTQVNTQVNRPRGHPKGSLNKSKVTAPDLAPPQSKKRGRPKGSPNKSTADKPKPLPSPPKMRGRPKGSRNKSTLNSAATVIQRYARRYINDYTSLVSQIQTN